ncbi:MAG TPA: integrin alpha [Actinomycetota bacterium]|nr:integrin alpha [Actinomycetota bacterium]
MRFARLPVIGALVVAMVWAGTGTGSAAAASRFVQRTHVLWSVNGDPGTLFGWAVSELADVNGDGVTDAIVSAPLDGGSSTGAVYAYSGANGDLLDEFHGQPNDLFGYAVADAGDVNDDGVHDILVGARGGNEAFVFSGATGSPTPLLTLHGEAAGDAFGFAVASAGDVNGDHHADVLVGAVANDAAGTNAGRAYVYSGADGSLLYSMNGDKAGDLFGSATDHTEDLNGDGVGDLLIGARNAGHDHGGRAYAYSGANGHRIWSSPKDKTNHDLGWFFVADVGDLNHDGVSDVYGGDFTYSVGGVNTGRVQIFSGVDGSVLRSWTGSSAKQGFGPGREAGDVDGDHIPDIAVGSYTSSDGAKAAGKVEIFSGATGDRLRVLTSTNAHENFGFDTEGLGDTNHDGHPDLLVSAATGSNVYLISGTN